MDFRSAPFVIVMYLLKCLVYLALNNICLNTGLSILFFIVVVLCRCIPLQELEAENELLNGKFKDLWMKNLRLQDKLDFLQQRSIPEHVSGHIVFFCDVS